MSKDTGGQTFTPGPWELKVEPLSQGDQDDRREIQGADGLVVCGWWSWLERHETHDANSRLIAAAPEKPYAMIGPDGWDYIGLHYDESEVWQIALGWPSPVEIMEHKANGAFVTEITCAYKSKGK